MRNSFLFIGFILMIFSVSCTSNDVIEIRQSDEGISQSIKVVDELIAAFDAIDDLVSVDSIMAVKGDAFITPDVKVTFMDASFTDGDGVEVVFDFGPVTQSPRGILCKDGRYRAGKITAYLSQPYTEIGANLTIVFPGDEPYYSGDGIDMVTFVGEAVLERTSIQQMQCKAQDLHARYLNVDHTVESDLLISKILDGGLGLHNDVMLFDGSVTTRNDQHVIDLTTVSPLMKKYTAECASNIVSGEMSSSFAQGKSEVLIDFDPYDDEACDNLVSITINGKTVMHYF